VLAAPPFGFVDDFGKQQHRLDGIQILRLLEVVTAQHADHEYIRQIFSGAALGAKAPLEIVFYAADHRELDVGKSLFECAGRQHRRVGAMHVNRDLTFFLRRLDGSFPFLLPTLRRLCGGETSKATEGN